MSTDIKATEQKEYECDLSQEIACIRWCMDDIKMLFDKNGIAFTEENVENFFNHRTVKTLDEGSIAHGWEILEEILYSYSEELTKINICNECDFKFEHSWYSINIELINGEEFIYDELVPFDELSNVTEKFINELGINKDEIAEISNGEYCPNCGHCIE